MPTLSATCNLSYAFLILTAGCQAPLRLHMPGASSSSLLLGLSPPTYLMPMGISHLNSCPFPYELPQDQHIHFGSPFLSWCTCTWGIGTDLPISCLSNFILLDLSYHYPLLKCFWICYHPPPTILSGTNFDTFSI